MIEFVCTPLPVRIAQQGCHGNHAFSHSPNVLEHFFFSFKGGGGEGQEFVLAPMKNIMGVQGRSLTN